MGYLLDKNMSTIKVDTIATRTGSGITVSNALSGTDIISTTNISDNAVTNAKIANSTPDLTGKGYWCITSCKR